MFYSKRKFSVWKYTVLSRQHITKTIYCNWRKENDKSTSAIHMKLKIIFKSTTLSIQVEINGIFNLTPIQFCIAKVRFFCCEFGNIVFKLCTNCSFLALIWTFFSGCICIYLSYLVNLCWEWTFIIYMKSNIFLSTHLRLNLPISISYQTLILVLELLW